VISSLLLWDDKKKSDKPGKIPDTLVEEILRGYQPLPLTNKKFNFPPPERQYLLSKSSNAQLSTEWDVQEEEESDLIFVRLFQKPIPIELNNH